MDTLLDPLYLLRLGPALVMLLFGVHQIFKPEKWTEEYILGWVKNLMPADPNSVMRVHAVGNVLISFYLISGIQPYIAAWAAFVWFLTILPFAYSGSWKTGLRDTVITISLLALILLLK